MVNAISLFTGAGGMDVGFENAGANILLANEVDKKAAETYSQRQCPQGMMWRCWQQQGNARKMMRPSRRRASTSTVPPGIPSTM